MSKTPLSRLRAAAPALLLAVGLLVAGCARQAPEAPDHSLSPVSVAPSDEAAGKAKGKPRRNRSGDPRSDEVSGQPLDRPLAVMIENHSAARPQAGLDRAEVVYEALAEGGIPRFLAIFTRDDAPLIGPVRSARPYYIDLMQGYDPVYVHCGQSIEAQQILEARRVPEINEIFDKRPFWRDEHRKRPHNLYTSTASLLREAERLGLATGSGRWSPPTDPSPLGGNAGTSIRIDYPYGQHYSVRYNYDPAANRYLRFMDGKPHLDAVTKEQLSARTLIVQEADSRPLEGAELGEIQVDVIGSGRCWFFRDGKWVLGHWRKDAPEVATVYSAESGDELRPGPGPTWIQIVPNPDPPKITGPEKPAKKHASV